MILMDFEFVWGKTYKVLIMPNLIEDFYHVVDLKAKFICI